MKMNKGMVKKLGMISLAALFAASLAACKPQDQGGSTTPTPAPLAPINGGNEMKVTPDPNATPVPVHDLYGYSYRFIRIPYSETVNSVPPIVITNAEKLREVITEYRSSTAASRASVDDDLKQYDEAFFKSNYILAFNLTFSSGSVVPKVTGVTNENGVVTVVTAGTMEGDVGTADMASHMCLLSLDAERFPENSTFKITGAGTVQGVDTKRN